MLRYNSSDATITGNNVRRKNTNTKRRSVQISESPVSTSYDYYYHIIIIKIHDRDEGRRTLYDDEPGERVGTTTADV